MYPSLFWMIFYRVMYVRIGVRGSNRGIVIGTRMTRFQDRDKANVCTFASELINSQPLSALTRLHLKIENTLSALMRLNLKIAKKSGCLHLNVWTKKVYPPKWFDIEHLLTTYGKKCHMGGRCLDVGMAGIAIITIIISIRLLRF